MAPLLPGLRVVWFLLEQPVLICISPIPFALMVGRSLRTAEKHVKISPSTVSIDHINLFS